MESSPKDLYIEQAKKVDRDTQNLAGGFNRVESYSELKLHGPEILPLLVEDIGHKPQWWEIQMIREFTEEVLEQCIVFPKEVRGKLQPVADRVTDWWNIGGHQSYNEALIRLKKLKS
jgi:hypothetical protein